MNHHATLLIAAAAVLAAPLAASAQTLDLPPRKAGLWELNTTIEKPAGMPPMATQMCIDAATDRELMDFGLRMSRDKCTRYNVKRAGATWVIDAECTLGPVKSAFKTTISGDFQSSVNLRMEGTTEGGFAGAGKGPQPTLMTQSGKWKSADCPGMKPGDISMFGGVKMNVKQLKSLPLLQLK